MRLTSIFRVCVILTVLCALVGCQQRAASKLQGRWEGRPDSADQRAARDAEKYDEQSRAVSSGQSEDSADTDQVTDWEAFDVTIAMDFVSSERIEMSLDGGQPIAGQWKILATTPSGCTIEVQTESNEVAEEPQAMRRRFELLLDERDGTCVGFQLTEAGADAQLGALYFQRPAATNRAATN